MTTLDDVNAQHLASMGLAGQSLGEPIREKDTREYLSHPNDRCTDVHPEDPDIRCVLGVDHEQPYHVRGQRSWRDEIKESGMTLTCDRAKESIPHAAHSYTVGEITHDCPGFLATVCARSRFGFVQADEPVCTFLYGHQGDHSWATDRRLTHQERDERLAQIIGSSPGSTMVRLRPSGLCNSTMRIGNEGIWVCLEPEGHDDGWHRNQDKFWRTPVEPDYRFVERILDAYFDGGALDFQGLPVPEEIQIYLADKILDQTNQEK